MSALDGFYATWNNARNQFGEGTPQGGSQVDASPIFSKLGEDVQAAAPGDTWTGAASEAYGGANTKHGQNLTKLAELDKRLGAQLDHSAEVTTTGRQNLDSVRQWVTDAASSIPPGKQRDTMLMQLASKGLGDVSNIVQTSNDENAKIRDNINGLKPEYDAVNYVTEEGEGDGKAEEEKTEEEKKKEEEDKRKAGIDDGTEAGNNDGASLDDGQLSPEEAARLQQNTSLTDQQKTDLNNGNLTLPPEQLAYLNGLSESLDGKSPSEIRAILDGLPPEQAKAVMNGMHLVGTDTVRTDVDPSIKPGEPGYVPATGGEDHLPQSIRDIFDAPLHSSPPHPNDPYANMQEYRDIAAISQMADPDLQRGSALNEGMLAQSRELLEDFESGQFPTYGSTDWGQPNLDPVLQDMLNAASNDPVAVHDAIAGADGKSPNDDFIRNLYEHQWADDGAAAGSLFPEQSDTSARAGQTMHAFDQFAGKNYQDLLNIHDKQSLGQINPALTQALAHANIPYLDDMFNKNINGTQGFSHLDGHSEMGGDANMPNTRGLFAVIDSDPTANSKFNTAATDLWKSYISHYSDSLVDGPAPDAGALQAAGYLQRMMDQGEFLHQYDLSGDKFAAAEKAFEARELRYDLAKDAVSFFPKAGDALAIYEAMPGDVLKDFFVGQEPTVDNPDFKPRNINEVLYLATSYAVAENAGDFSQLGNLVVDGKLADFSTASQSVTEMTNYLSTLAEKNDMGFLLYTTAYETGLTISDDELSELQEKGK